MGAAWNCPSNDLLCCGSILREDQHGYRDCEVVQSNEGLRVHSTDRRRQRCVISAVERAGLVSLNEGQHVEYEIENNHGKESAINLKVKQKQACYSKLVCAIADYRTKSGKAIWGMSIMVCRLNRSTQHRR
jgi:hypothetical protein